MLTRIYSGWVQNTALSELTAEKAKDTITEKMRKDLKAAFELAAEQHPVEHYQGILKSFQEELLAQEQARAEAAATPKKSKKSKTKAADEDEDADMEDADAPPKSAKSKKRKAEEDISVSIAQLLGISPSQRLTRDLYRPRSDLILSRSRRSSSTHLLRRRTQTAPPRPSPLVVLRRSQPKRSPRRPRRVPRKGLKLPRKQR